MSLGFDCGTYNLVVCRRDGKKNFSYKREINAFIELSLENKFVFNMMKKSGVPLVENPEANIGYAFGEAAVNMAYTMNQVELKRPMKDGCLNPKEKNAQQLMSIMMQGLIGKSNDKKELLYYSVPANALNEETDADYHSLVLKAIFDAFEDDNGNKVDARPINEALALVYAELESKAYTGIGISCGAGMINICYAIFGNPVFQFAIVNSGDWIDKMAAKVTGETTTFINKEKMKVDLLDENGNFVQKAIKAQYEILIQKTVSEIKKGMEKIGGNARKADAPVDIVVAGGTASPNGFKELFEQAAKKANLPIEIGNVIKPADPLFAVARGCLIAAENSQ